MLHDELDAGRLELERRHGTTVEAGRDGASHASQGATELGDAERQVARAAGALLDEQAVHTGHRRQRGATRLAEGVIEERFERGHARVYHRHQRAGGGARACYRAHVSQLHVRANEGAVAEYVLLPGDPNRATRIADAFLDDVVRYNEHRQLLGYTGTYRGMRVSVQATGMGCPSLAIVTEELIRLGARRLVRVGTAGIISDRVQPGELIVATSSVANDGTTRQYLRGAAYAPSADHAVVSALVAAGHAAGQPPHVGLIQTEDAFYATGPDDVPELRARGVLAIEMEASALFLIAALRGVSAGCALVASNHIGDPAFVPQAVLDAGVEAMTRMALEAGLALQQPA